MGQGGMDTLNKNMVVNDPKNIYNKHYTVDLGAISLRCFENVKNYVKNKKYFDLLNDVKLIVTLSTLNKKKFSARVSDTDFFYNLPVHKIINSYIYTKEMPVLLSEMMNNSVIFVDKDYYKKKKKN